MGRLLSLAAVCCSIATAEAAVFKWTANDGARRWTPAQETFGVMPLLGMNPVPTSPPNLQESKEHKRVGGDNTCAYVNGDPDIPLYCDVNSACVYNSVRSNIGCCPDTSTTCSIWTTCLDSSDKNLFTTDNGYTLWCGSSEYPYCKTHLYEDDTFTGYTLLGCAVAAGTDSVVYSPTLSMSSLSSKSSTSDSSSLTSSFGVEATSSSAPRASNVGSTTTTSSNPASTTAVARSGSSSAPIGAIVGGVVGGVAVVALFALGLVLLLRRRRSHQAPASDPYTPMNPPGANPSQQPPSQPAMQQQFQQPHLQPAPSPASFPAAAPVFDNRSSIAKPSLVSTTQPVYSPTAAGSPPPQSQSPGAIPPAYQATNTSTTSPAATQRISPTTPGAPQEQRPGSYANPGYQDQVQPAYHQHNGHYYEMPTVKSDRELRELA
ncbi:hypothetical protein LA080_014610 [Diaporthe eres]|uniref:Mid2 domain-containing protein n=1 Tax=Diaporthe vaccinii TaxID=105482 RepID=A0ABR4EDB6_9PEZI|nr:hypothetical protein LA080_014610 [Diaporthe eres]